MLLYGTRTKIFELKAFKSAHCQPEAKLAAFFLLFFFFFFFLPVLPSTSMWGTYSETLIHHYNIPLTHTFTCLYVKIFSRRTSFFPISLVWTPFHGLNVLSELQPARCLGFGIHLMPRLCFLPTCL